MTERPSTRQLEYLVALADRLHFGRAAEACFVTQPTLSNQIKELEGALGVRLFERDRRHVLPTPAGEALAGRARHVLREIDDLIDAARGFGEPLAGPLRLGVIPTIAPYLLPGALAEIRTRFPKLRLFVREDPTDRLLEQLADGRLDGLLLAREADLGDVTTLDLFTDPFLLAVPEDHPLAGRKRVRPADLEGERVVLLEEGHCLRDQALDLCRSRGAGQPREFQASSLSTLVQSISTGAGITVVPELALGVEDRPERALRFIRFPRPEPFRTICLAWRRTSPRGEELRLLGEELARAAPAARRKLAVRPRGE